MHEKTLYFSFTSFFSDLVNIVLAFGPESRVGKYPRCFAPSSDRKVKLGVQSYTEFVDIKNAYQLISWTKFSSACTPRTIRCTWFCRLLGNDVLQYLKVGSMWKYPWISSFSPTTILLARIINIALLMFPSENWNNLSLSTERSQLSPYSRDVKVRSTTRFSVL